MKLKFTFSRRVLAAILISAASFSSLSAAEKDLRFSGEAPALEEPLSLWYRRPAGGWLDAVALGNGRLGAMVHGRVQEERITINEDTVWSGGPYQPAAEVAPRDPCRPPVFRGQNREAQNLAGKMQGQPNSQAAYQTVGELLLNFPPGENELKITAGSSIWIPPLPPSPTRTGSKVLPLCSQIRGQRFKIISPAPAGW